MTKSRLETLRNGVLTCRHHDDGSGEMKVPNGSDLAVLRGLISNFFGARPAFRVHRPLLPIEARESRLSARVGGCGIVNSWL